jgi:hypothetical protein
MSPTTHPHQPLAAYLLDRLEFLIDCDSRLENLVGIEQRGVIEHYERNGITRQETNRLLLKLEYGVLRTHRFLTLMGVCAYVEEAVKLIAAIAVPGYKQGAIRYDIFKQHIRHLEKHGFNRTPVKEQIDRFLDIIQLRNLVTHEWGKFVKKPLKGKKQKQDRLTVALSRLAQAAEKPNLELVTMSADGYLIPGSNLVAYSYGDLAEPIIDSLLTQLLGVSLR